MESIDNISLAKIVTMKPETASLFEKHNLDFCCKGKQTLAEALSDNEEEFEIVKNQLEDIFSRKVSVSGKEFKDYTLVELVDYIISKHHVYVKELAPMISAHLNKVADKHGNRYSYLLKVNQLFADVKRELLNHMMKEEVILFPRIKGLELAAFNNAWETAKIEIHSPINVMMVEHDIAGELMSQIRELTGNYNPPADACTTFRLSFEELKTFEEDLHLHVHLENNILFPKALEILNKVQMRNN